MAKKRKLEATGADRSELRTLLAVAKSDYWDDGPRLALADWLEENGDEADRARAEIIRSQLDTARGGPDWKHAVDKVRDKHVRDWVLAHRDFFRYRLPDCARGLLTADMSVSYWLRDGLIDEAWEWVETATPASLVGTQLPRLLESQRLSTVPRLDLGYRSFSDPALRQALAHVRCGQVLSLSLTGYRSAVAELERGLRPGLQELSLHIYNDTGEWPGFFASEGVQGLSSLSLRSTPFGDGGAETLASSLPGLRRFAGDGRRMTTAGLAALARLPLRHLALHRANFGPDWLAILATGACRDTLEELRLPNVQLRCAFSTGLALPRLRRLVLIGCGLGTGDAQELAKSGLMARLDELDLSGNQADDTEGVAALAATGAMGPRTLRLGNCKLGDAGASRLAAWPGLARVRCLDLSNNGISEAGIRALAESPHAGALEALDLQRNGTNLVAVLLRSPLCGRLAWLALNDATPGRAVAAALSEAAPPRLRELRLSWQAHRDIGASGMAALRAKLPQCAIG